MTSRAIFPLQQWLGSTNQNSTSANSNALAMEAWLGPATFADAAPTTPADHDQHVVRTAWGSFGVGNILIWLGGAWHEFASVDGMTKSINDRNYVRKGGVWQPTPIWASVPANATSPGSPGELAYDSANLYVCFADSSWARSALSTW